MSVSENTAREGSEDEDEQDGSESEAYGRKGGGALQVRVGVGVGAGAEGRGLPGCVRLLVVLLGVGFVWLCKLVFGWPDIRMCMAN